MPFVCIAHDPGVRLRDIAEALHISERSAHAVGADLTAAGYMLETRDGRRNRFRGCFEHARWLPRAGMSERIPAAGRVFQGARCASQRDGTKVAAIWGARNGCRLGATPHQGDRLVIP